MTTLTEKFRRMRELQKDRERKGVFFPAAIELLAAETEVDRLLAEPAAPQAEPSDEEIMEVGFRHFKPEPDLTERTRSAYIASVRECLALRSRAPVASDAVGVQTSTPSSHWHAAGEADPHAGHYDKERAALCMGNLTDDELANGAFMNYNAPLDVQGILAGRCHSPIAWMTAVKDRIRWLSRSLDRALAAAAPPQPVTQGAVEVCPECDIADCRHIRERRAARSKREEGGS